MKTYRRILVPIPADGQGDVLLQRAAELAKAQHAQMLVVRVLDTGSRVVRQESRQVEVPAGERRDVAVLGALPARCDAKEAT